MSATPFTNKKFMAYAIKHMNDDHRPDMVAMVKVFLHMEWACDVEMVSYDQKCMKIIVRDGAQRSETHTLQFPKLLEREQDIRGVLVHMVKEAKGKV